MSRFLLLTDFYMCVISKSNMAKKGKGRLPWVFTPKRKSSLRKAQRTHVELVKLGKVARARRK